MKVAVIMGSDSDFQVMKKCIETLVRFEVEYEVSVISAHRDIARLSDYIKSAGDKGVELVIAAAGKAAHLPGVIAAMTTVPVIGVPIKSSTMDGLDSLLSIVQMPPGVPVATVAVDGSQNAALLAVEILSLKYESLKEKLVMYRETMKKQVLEKDIKIKEEANELWKN